MSVDNLVYHRSLVAFQRNQLDRWGDNMPLNDVVQYCLLNVGGWDMDTVDKPWDASTHSMRFMTCVGDRLWAMITREQKKVCVLFLCFDLRN